MRYIFENKGSFDLGIPYRKDKIPIYVSILMNHLAYNPDPVDITIVARDHISIKMLPFRDFKSYLGMFQKYYPRRGEFIFTENSKGNLSIEYHFDMGLQFLILFIAGVIPGIFTISSLCFSPACVGLVTFFFLFWVLLVYMLSLAIIKIIPVKNFIRMLIGISKKKKIRCFE